jgi:hypothetical protein
MSAVHEAAMAPVAHQGGDATGSAEARGAFELFRSASGGKDHRDETSAVPEPAQ